MQNLSLFLICVLFLHNHVFWFPVNNKMLVCYSLLLFNMIFYDLQKKTPQKTLRDTSFYI